MALLYLVPTVLSLLIFCAHLFRAGALLFVPLVLLTLPLLLLEQGWVARLFQFLLLFIAFEWVLTATFLANARQETGEPWVRMVMILGCVALFAVGSAALFETPRLHRRYPRRFRM
jgi:hypothetical protein